MNSGHFYAIWYNEGRPVNELKSGIILLIFKIWRISDIAQLIYGMNLMYLILFWEGYYLHY